MCVCVCVCACSCVGVMALECSKTPEKHEVVAIFLDFNKLPRMIGD